MRVKLPTFGVAENTESKTSEVVRYILFVLVLLIVIGVIVLVFIHIFRSPTKIPAKPDTTVNAVQVEAADQAQTNVQLAEKDYASYQISQRMAATQYLNESDYKDAVRIMDTVMTNVPAAQVTSASYEVMFTAQQGLKDTAAEKKYLNLLIPRLKTEQDTQGAAHYQSILDGLK